MTYANKRAAITDRNAGYAGLTFGEAKFVCFTLVSFQNDSKVTGLARRGVSADVGCSVER